MDRLLAEFAPFGVILVFLLHLFLGLGLGADAAYRLRNGKPVAFFGPVLWMFATVVGSVLTVALYWVIHYSTLRRPDEFPSR